MATSGFARFGLVFMYRDSKSLVVKPSNTDVGLVEYSFVLEAAELRAICELDSVIPFFLI